MGWGDDHHTRVFLFDPRYSAKRKKVDIDEHLLLEPQKRGTANRKTLDILYTRRLKISQKFSFYNVYTL